MADAQPDAVDDLKRRARRRLVGAVVLALAAAVVLPIFLESDPKPLGKDVQIDIPPVDNERFVSRLTASNAPPAMAPTPGLPAPATTPAKPAQAPEAAGAAPPAKTADKPLVKTDTVATPQAATAPGAPSKETNSSEPSPSKAADAKPAIPRPVAASEFVVQLAAFAEPGTAHALERKLKADGFPAYTETLKTSHGALTRVRVGPFASRETADGARAKLKDAGQNGIVTPLH